MAGDGLASGLANSWLDTLQGTSYTQTTSYVQLHTGDPGAAGTSNISVGSTTRQAADVLRSVRRRPRPVSVADGVDERRHVGNHHQHHPVDPGVRRRVQADDHADGAEGVEHQRHADAEHLRDHADADRVVT